MSEIKQYDKGYSPSALQRKYSLTYEQGAELADYIQGLKELLKECRTMIGKLGAEIGTFDVVEIMLKIDNTIGEKK